LQSKFEMIFIIYFLL